MVIRELIIKREEHQNPVGPHIVAADHLQWKGDPVRQFNLIADFSSMEELSQVEASHEGPEAVPVSVVPPMLLNRSKVVGDQIDVVLFGEGGCCKAEKPADIEDTAIVVVAGDARRERLLLPP